MLEELYFILFVNVFFFDHFLTGKAKVIYLNLKANNNINIIIIIIIINNSFTPFYCFFFIVNRFNLKFTVLFFVTFTLKNAFFIKILFKKKSVVLSFMSWPNDDQTLTFSVLYIHKINKIFIKKKKQTHFFCIM
jgi:hypothetical protein